MGVIKIHLPPASSALSEPFVGFLDMCAKTKRDAAGEHESNVPASPVEGQVCSPLPRREARSLVRCAGATSQEGSSEQG